MIEYRIVLGLAGSIVGIASYVPYFRDMFRGKTKPHPFSWFVWGLVSAIGFFAQILSGGGIGAWTTGITAFACFAIAGFAVFLGEKHISKIDVVCFVGALVGIAAWGITSNPLSAVVIIVAVHLLGFIPTFRKAYASPEQETISTWILSLVKWILGIAALASFTFTTALFPLAVFAMNATFLIMLLVRRRTMR